MAIRYVGTSGTNSKLTTAVKELSILGNGSLSTTHIATLVGTIKSIWSNVIVSNFVDRSVWSHNHSVADNNATASVNTASKILNIPRHAISRNHRQHQHQLFYLHA